MRKWDDLSMREKAEMMRVAVSNGITTLPEIRQAYNEFAEGGEKNSAMTGMMKSKMAIAAHFGNPTARRMTNYDTRSYTWPNEYEYDKGIGEPKRGNVFVGSYDNLVTPHIQDTGKGLTLIDDVWSPKNDQRSYMQSLKFNNEQDARYFGEHYKEIAPMMNLYSNGGKKGNNSKSVFLNSLEQSLREDSRFNSNEWRKFFTDLAEMESSYSPDITNSIGAKGYFQLMPFNRAKAWTNPTQQFHEMYKLTGNNLKYLQKNLTEKDWEWANKRGIDMYGMLAGAHLGGVGNVVNAIRGKGNAKDMNGSSVIGYMTKFSQNSPTRDIKLHSPYKLPEQEIPFTPWNERAFYTPLTAYQPIVLPDEQQPIVREALAYDPKEIERQERRRGLNNFMTLMSMASPQQDNSMLGAISMLSGLGTANAYGEGGDIFIKPENRGKFTALKERTGHSATWFKEHGTPAQKKMAVFALNARHWKHADGGNLFNGEETTTQQMDRPNIFRYDDGRYVYQAAPDAEEIEVSPINTLLPNPSQWTYQDASGKIYTPHTAQVDTGSIIQDEERNPLVRAANNYFREAAYRAKDGTLALQGKYTMPAIAASALLPVAGEAAYPILTNPYVDAGIASAFAGHGLNHTINEGIDGWEDAAMTALELAPLGRLAKPMYEGVVQPGMRLFNSTLTPRPQYSPIIQRSVGTSITTGTNEETAKAVEKGRSTLLDWIRSPFYKARLEDEPLYRFADGVVADAGKMIEEVPIDISKTKLDLDPSGLVNGITKTKPAIQTQLPDGTIIADLNTGLDVSVASDLGKDADETALHELLHYMTANSKGEPISKAGERIVSKGYMNPTETHFDAINIIHKNRSKSWQDYIMDQNESLLPQYDPVVKMVMEEPDKAISFLEKAGKSTQEAKNAIQSLRTRYSEWYDIQEQRAYLQQLFHSKIKPNLKNPNDAAEIEEYLSSHPEVLENFPAYKYIQEVRPGSIKDYAKYFSAALGTIPFISKPSKDE